MADSSHHRVRQRRLERQWSQAELAQRAGISRSAVSAVEAERLVPSVAAALALARVFECSVEDLFGVAPSLQAGGSAWAWQPTETPWRYWSAMVGERTLHYPVEPTDGGMVEHDGVFGADTLQPRSPFDPRRTLVMATCDPAAGLLAARLAQAAGVRLLVFPRSSHEALRLLKDGLIHVAGVHLAAATASKGNAEIVHEKLGSGYCLLRIAHWQEGVALAPHTGIRSVEAALRANLRWVAREPGSGARQCLDELLGDRPARRIARSHRHVAEAIRSGWADAGVCVKLTCAEAGLNFLRVREEKLDLCFPESWRDDSRIAALLQTVRSTSYRHMLADLPGYKVTATGETESC